MTPLDKSLKRILTVNRREYVVTLTPETLKLTEKGHRLGLELKWADLVTGESALAVALHASIGKFQGEDPPLSNSPKGALRRSAAARPARARARPKVPKRPR
jgi:hypothetical protein